MLAAVAILPMGSAEECEPGGPTPDAAFAGYYLEADACGAGCVASTWLYEESNGLPGLQRRDAAMDHTCAGMQAPDTLVVGARR